MLVSGGFKTVPPFNNQQQYYKEEVFKSKNSCDNDFSDKANFHVSQDGCNNSNCFDNNFSDDCCNNAYEQCINIFGLELHFDDLLILGLLFFLYKEEVKDNYLYIVLLMLLFS